jgi:hypothetical protein
MSNNVEQFKYQLVDADAMKRWEQKFLASADFFTGSELTSKFNGQIGGYELLSGERSDLMGSTHVALCNMSGHGYTHFQNGQKIKDWIVMPDQEPPPRETLPCTDQALWPLWQGQKSDPVQYSAYLRTLDARNAENVIILSSGGALREFRNLMRAFVLNMRAAQAVEYPRIVLATRRFKNRHGGFNYAPEFQIVGWVRPEHVGQAAIEERRAAPEILTPDELKAAEAMAKANRFDPAATAKPVQQPAAPIDTAVPEFLKREPAKPQGVDRVVTPQGSPAMTPKGEGDDTFDVELPL